jgi:hypothetical protein
LLDREGGVSVTLTELRTTWTVRDLVDAHRWLDAKAAVQEVLADED